MRHCFMTFDRNRQGKLERRGNRAVFAVWAALLSALILLGISFSALASEDDNSLYSLGIKTDGAVVEPEFSYDIWEYEVTVPAGTKELALEPVPSSEIAELTSVTGTTLENGEANVVITVTAANGAPHEYVLHVKADAEAAQPETQPVTEAETQPVTEKQKETEASTEDVTIVKVPKDTVEQAERTIKELQDEIVTYRDNVNLYTKIIYGMIAACVILLFLVINLILRGRDLKSEVKEYRSLGYTTQKQQRKAMKKAQKANRAAMPPAHGAPQQPAAGKMPGAGPKSAGVNPEEAAHARENAGDKTPSGAPAASGREATPRQAAYYEKAPLDVMPQTSKKTRQMPAYEQENQAAHTGREENIRSGEKDKSVTPPEAEPPKGTGKGRTRKKDVEINMIDL